MELIILGSGGGPQPSAHRGSPGVLIVHDDRLHVIDSASGTPDRIVAAGHELRDLRGVYITHHHVDHNADYGNLLALSWTAGLVDQVQAFGPSPITAMTDEYVQLIRVDVEHREALGRPSLRGLIDVHDIADDGVVFDKDGLRVTAAAVTHPPLDAYGYRFEADGTSVVISGDTAPCAATVDLARGADVLVHEAYSPDDLHLLTAGTNAALDRLQHHFAQAHTTAEEAGRMAAAAGVRTLVLWHLIPRSGVDTDDWLEQASRHFDGQVIVSEDLMKIDVRPTGL